ncbi:cytochrome C peroxidase [Bacterioplanes sanyensis]|uniref:Cytochrome C peroxidase n=1 Tax=Bacterioplanes sanyensis TaxID=1249553 RepID=A0A222FGT0_9GAMM|nr:cytochrome c peroxidase [Bacterioplanes sanyensis]ASP38198.1 cytochrome C peroxidase [Bacterioplanes sanyensis]
MWRRKESLSLGSFIFLLAFSCSAVAEQSLQEYQFTAADIQFLSQFQLDQLAPPPKAIGNRVADDIAAARLGKALFFDAELSGNGSVACSSCHQPQRYFTDGLARSVALGVTQRNAPSIATSQYGPWQFWDGRADSLWAQALAPLEDVKEHGIARSDIARYIARAYAREYQQVFGELPVEVINSVPAAAASPRQGATALQHWQQLTQQQQHVINQVFANVGKALMAYQRRIDLQPAPFDRFVQALQQQQSPQQLQRIMTADEVKGLRVFMGKGNCASCHNGPLFTNFEFHNVGAPEPNTANVDMGRYEGVVALQNSEFTCLSQFSDADKKDCEEMLFLKKQGPELVGAFKTPSLRNVGKTAPYMQSGQMADLMSVIAHYNKPLPPFYDRAQHPSRPHFDIVPLNLTEDEQRQLVLFLHTLTSPIDITDPWWLADSP